MITSLKLREAIRQGYAWPGGYTLFGITGDGGCLCCDCMRKEYHQIAYSRRHNLNDGWRVEAIDMGGNTDQDTPCDHCGKQLSDYYTPNED